MKKKSPGKVKRSGYVHYQYIPLEVGLAAINAAIDEPMKKVRHQVGDHEVHTTSLRLRVFALKGITCYICGLKATQFSIDDTPTGKTHHMNLWGTKDGMPMLFTHDHVIDRSKGGADELHNVEPCCAYCNNQKNMRENYVVNN